MYQILKSVSHLKSQLVLTYNKDRIIIYTKEILQHFQTLREFMSDVVAVASSKNGVFVVFCEREIIAYKPKFQSYERSYNKNATNPIKDAFFSNNDEYIIGCQKNQLIIWSVKYNKYNVAGLDQVELIGMQEIFTLELQSEISNVKFSPDIRYFATMSLSLLTVWDFEAIKEFPQDGDISQIPSLKLDHQDNLISFKFRDTVRIAPSPLPTPNSVITLTNNNILTIWQEMICTKQFCKLHIMLLNRVSSFCFINIKGQVPYPYICNYIEQDQLGIQDTENLSVDYILIHEEQEMKIFKIDYLRNYSIQESVTLIKQSKATRLLNTIKKIILADQISAEEDKLDIVGFDKLWNIVKVIVNLNENTIVVHTCEKASLQKIEWFSINQQNMYIINDWNYLCRLALEQQQIIAQEYLVQNSYQALWNFNFDLTKYSYFYHIQDFKLASNDILLFIDKHFKQCFAIITDENLLFRQIQLESNINGNILQIKQIFKNDNELDLLILTPDAIYETNIQITSDMIVDQIKSVIVMTQEIPITFDYDRISLGSYDHIITIQQKQFTIYDKELNKLVNIQKNYNIKEVGIIDDTPTFYSISYQNDIDFHNKSGEFITRFSLLKFLARVDKSLYDVVKVTLKVIPFKFQSFFLQIDYYLCAFQIVFDRQEQKYRLQILQNKYIDNRVTIDYKRFSKYSKPLTYEFHIHRNNLVVKQEKKIRIVNQTFSNCLYDNNWMISNIDYKLLQTQNQVQLIDPDLIIELLSLGKFQLVNYIIKCILFKLQHHGALGQNLTIPYKHLLDIFEYGQQLEWVLENKPYDQQTLSEDIKEQIDLQNPIYSFLKIYEHTGFSSRFRIVLEFLKYYEDNQRSLDFYASMFMFYAHMFRSTPSGKKNRVLSSKEVVWAMHTLQKETLWQECIQSQETSWNLIKRYSAVIWMDIQFIKKTIEDIASEAYKQTKDPFQSLLYYIMVGKKSVITMLFKREVPQGQMYKNTFEFLQQDFSLDRWKSAASKNAFALVSKKRYQDAAAFFLVGGHLYDAVDVMANKMEDIQLALLTAKLFEPNGGIVTEKLIQQHFIKAGEDLNDIWLLHIGYQLLGKYVDSVNVLMRQPSSISLDYDQLGKPICNQWPSTFTPQTSNFHPSALLLLEKVRDTLNVKREIQASIDKNKKKVDDDIFASFYDEPSQKEEEQQEIFPVKSIQDNQEYLKRQAVEYYYNIQIPQLGFYISQDVEDCDTSKLVDQQLEMYLNDAIKEKEHFMNYNLLMLKLDEFSAFIHKDKELIYKQILNKFQRLRSPSRLLTFSINYNQTGINDFMNFCCQAQSLLYRVCNNYPLLQKDQEFYLSLLQSLYEIDVGLKQFQQSKYYQKNFDGNKHKLNVIKLLGLFITLLLVLEFRLWDKLPETLRKWDTFCHIVFSQNNVDFEYENLRDDFCDLIKEKLSNKQFYKLKSKKANRNADILGEAFPEDKYNIQIQHQFEEEEQQSNYIILLKALQSRIVWIQEQKSEKFFGQKQQELFDLKKISYHNIFKMAKLYYTTRSKMLQCWLINLSDFSLEQKILDDLRLIIKEQSVRNSQCYLDLEQFIDPAQFFTLAQQIQLDQYLDQIILQRNKEAFKYPQSSFEDVSIQQYKSKIFKQSIEVYKIKTDNIKSFCFNNANISKGVVLYNKYLKPINIQNTLLLKNRAQDGYVLVEEETIEENSRIQQNTNRPQIIKQIQQCLFNDEREPLLKQRTSIYDEYRAFTDKDYIEKFQQYQTKNIQEDEQQCLEAHPHLPIFLNGGKGSVNVMSFQTNQFLSEFQTSQKEYVDMLKFNNSGEMFLGHDLGNNSFLWKLNKSSKSNLPLFQLNNKNRPTSDLCFVNEGSVFASIYNSSSRPHFGIYDLLLPGTKNIVAEEKFTGTDILFSTPMNSILIGNSKKGSVNFLDIRKNQIYQTFEIPMVEIKLIKLNQYQNKMICACSDGTIKFVVCKSLQIIHDVKPFKHEKKQPQIVSLCQTENATFAASSDGVISLVYLNI